MADPFIAQIVQFGGNFAPRGWALCDGQLLAISSNTALFSILGTTYGGDGRTTFALPDLRGRVSVHPGTGPGLTPYPLGDKGGAETHTLPAHNHAGTGRATSHTPGASLAPAPGTGFSSGGIIGAAPSTSNLQPYLSINYIIATVGTFPSRN